MVVGYPTVLPHGAGGRPALPIGSGDVADLRDALKHLDTVLPDQAKAHRAGYADTAGASTGHDIGTASGTRWVEGLAPTSAAAPLHPNARGEAGIAATVETVVA